MTNQIHLISLDPNSITVAADLHLENVAAMTIRQELKPGDMLLGRSFDWWKDRLGRDGTAIVSYRETLQDIPPNSGETEA